MTKLTEAETRRLNFLVEHLREGTLETGPEADELADYIEALSSLAQDGTVEAIPKELLEHVDVTTLDYSEIVDRMSLLESWVYELAALSHPHPATVDTETKLRGLLKSVDGFFVDHPGLNEKLHAVIQDVLYGDLPHPATVKEGGEAWQPIETAPKTEGAKAWIFGCAHNEEHQDNEPLVYEAVFRDGYWRVDGIRHLTIGWPKCWMPREKPQPPTDRLTAKLGGKL